MFNVKIHDNKDPDYFEWNLEFLSTLIYAEWELWNYLLGSKMSQWFSYTRSTKKRNTNAVKNRLWLKTNNSIFIRQLLCKWDNADGISKVMTSTEEGAGEENEPHINTYVCWAKDYFLLRKF